MEGTQGIDLLVTLKFEEPFAAPDPFLNGKIRRYTHVVILDQRKSDGVVDPEKCLERAKVCFSHPLHLSDTVLSVFTDRCVE